MTKIKLAPFVGKPGKLPAKNDPRDFNFSNYFDLHKVGKIPLSINWTIKKTSPWGMMNNWTLNDCTCAAAGHMIECWSANATKEHIIHNNAVIKTFTALSGYDPVSGKNDNPVYISAALKYWRKNGVGDHKIKFYATINYKSHALLRAAVYLFGGIYVGLNLPATIKGQEVWEVVQGDNAPGSFGGHAVNVVAYDKVYVTCVSWGKIKKMTWAFWDAYCDESYAIISEDFFNENKSPIGLDMDKLEESLLGLTKAKKTLLKEITKKQTKMKKQIKISKKVVVAVTKKAAGHSGGKGGSAGKETSIKSKKAPTAVKAIAVSIKSKSKKSAVAAGNSGGHSGTAGKTLSTLKAPSVVKLIGSTGKKAASAGKLVGVAGKTVLSSKAASAGKLVGSAGKTVSTSKAASASKLVGSAGKLVGGAGKTVSTSKAASASKLVGSAGKLVGGAGKTVSTSKAASAGKLVGTAGKLVGGAGKTVSPSKAASAGKKAGSAGKLVGVAGKSVSTSANAMSIKTVKLAAGKKVNTKTIKK